MSETTATPGRSQRITFRISLQERTKLDSLASQSGLGVSEFIRRAALSKVIASRTDAEMVRELRRLGAMLKHLYPKHSNWSSSEKERYWTSMNQITRLAERLQTVIKTKG